MSHVDTPAPHPVTTCIEWFYGGGGNHLGLSRVIPGLRLVAVAEIEAYAVANLVEKVERGRMGAVACWTDIKSFPCEPFRDRIDLFVASFPCQPFSCAGAQESTEDERHLYPYVGRAVSVIRPRRVLLENVEGIISARTIDHRPDLVRFVRGLRAAAARSGKARNRWRLERSADRTHRYFLRRFGISVLHYVCCDLEARGYCVASGIFSAEECGASHRRKRVFILGELRELADAHGQRRQQKPGDASRDERTDGRQSNGDHEPAGDEQGMAIASSGRLGARREQPLRTGQSALNGSGRAVADARRLAGARHDKPLHGGEHEDRAAAKNGSAKLADPGDGQLSQQGRRAEGRNGTRPAGAQMANAESGGQRELRESSEQPGRQSDGCNPPVADTARHGGNGSHGQNGSGRGVCENGDCDGKTVGNATGDDEWRASIAAMHGQGQQIGRPSGSMADAERAGLREQRRGEPARGQHPAAEHALPDFPPCPDDYEGWASVLAAGWLDLLPAVPQSALRGVADGLAAGLDADFNGLTRNRIDRLRMLGNGVVPDTAALAYVTLDAELAARRAATLSTRHGKD